MAGPTCECCGNAAVFVIREMEDGVARERHLCAAHALNLDLPPGTYILDNRAYPSFAALVAAVALAPAASRRLQAHPGAPNGRSLTPSP